MPALRHLAALLVLFVAANLHAGTHYVDLNSTNPVAPYTSWATAATNIQDAIDAATNGDTVLVTNGVYQTGGRTVPPYILTNRVVIDKPITVQSVNGSYFTAIRGLQPTVPGGSPVRCVYMADGSTLDGFRIQEGKTIDIYGSRHDGSGAGIFCESTNAHVSNCEIYSNQAEWWGGGIQSGTLTGCSIAGNIAFNGGGGGASQSVLNNCSILNNVVVSGASAGLGAGADECSLDNCFLNNNAGGIGGGASSSTLKSCTVIGNYAFAFGGGLYYCVATNCVITANFADLEGGGASESELHNCLISSNTAMNTVPIFAIFAVGGGASYSKLFNCTVASNYADTLGGIAGCDANNCIIYSNQAAIGNQNFSPTETNILDFCCTFPLATNGTGNITNEPRFFDPAHNNFHLQASSPCIDAGNNAYVSGGTDLDGNTRIVAGTVDIGAYEFQSLRHLVSLASTNPVSPFASWATAATNIQDAVDVATNGDVVVVTNGIYDAGSISVPGTGSTLNRVAVTNAISIQSVNGPSNTIIQGVQGDPIFGNGAVRCVYMGPDATLSGFTLAGGGTHIPQGADDLLDSGGGVFCNTSNVIVSNCIFLTNRSGSRGGGAYGVTLNNCLIVSNVSAYGGGASFCTLYNCTVTDNSAGGGGGGIRSSSALNSIICSNSAQIQSESNCSTSYLVYSCTTPIPTNGSGNFTNDPLFIDPANGNFRLQSNSPCINAGFNNYAPASPDLDNNPRIAGGTVDIGAYEFQSPASTLSYQWAQQYGLATDGSADFADADSDGMNNWQEWRAGTNPTNAASLLILLPPQRVGTNIVVTWQSVTNRRYLLYRFEGFGTNIVSPIALEFGQPGTTCYTDSNAPSPGPGFYRVVVTDGFIPAVIKRPPQ